MSKDKIHREKINLLAACSLKLAACSLMLVACSHAGAQSFQVVSYNIRYNNPDDGLDKWENRKETAAEPKKHIDYIWYSPKDFESSNYVIETPKTEAGRQASDHFPVVATLRFVGG